MSYSVFVSVKLLSRRLKLLSRPACATIAASAGINHMKHKDDGDDLGVGALLLLLLAASVMLLVLDYSVYLWNYL